MGDLPLTPAQYDEVRVLLYETRGQVDLLLRMIESASRQAFPIFYEQLDPLVERLARIEELIGDGEPDVVS